MSTTLTLGTSWLLQQPQVYVAWTHQDVGNAPLRFGSMLTWLHHIISAGLAAAH